MADDEVGERLLVVDQLGDALLDGALADQLVHEHRAALADAPGPVGGLVLDRRVPPAVVVDHLARRREVEPGAPGLERHQEQRGSGTILELGDEPVAAGLRHRPVEERHRPPEALGDVPAQQRPHLDELGEHQRPLADVDELVDELVEAGQLAGAAVQSGIVAERMDGVVADLLELGEGGEHDRAALHALVVIGGFEQFVDDVLVEHRLLAGEAGPGDLLDLVGQLGHELAIGLGTAQHEWPRQRPQRRRRFGGDRRVVAALDRLGVAMAEALARSEHAGVDPVEDRPQLGEPILDRRAGEGDALPGAAAGARPWLLGSPGS